MTPAEELQSLKDTFPLPPHVELDEPFLQVVDVGGVSIHLVGLAVDHDGECITGSAGALDGFPVLRAYMELLERLATLAVPASPSLDSSSIDPSRWRASRSNGVAIGTSFEDAARRATCELVERDRVLRSWFGGAPPRRVVDAGAAPRHLRGLASLGAGVTAGLSETYEFEGYSFDEAHGLLTAGVFGFPRGDAPLVYGFASRASGDEALKAALDEAIQRLGFLWGEPIPEVVPEPAPTPDFHQEHFLHPLNHEVLRRWLRGEHSRGPAFLKAEAPLADPAVEELRPPWLSPKLSVVRALPRGHVPLGFGLDHPLLAFPAPPDRAVHPMV